MRHQSWPPHWPMGQHLWQQNLYRHVQLVLGIMYMYRYLCTLVFELWSPRLNPDPALNCHSGVCHVSWISLGIWSCYLLSQSVVVIWFITYTTNKLVFSGCSPVIGERPSSAMKGNCYKRFNNTDMTIYQHKTQCVFVYLSICLSPFIRTIWVGF